MSLFALSFSVLACFIVAFNFSFTPMCFREASYSSYFNFFSVFEQSAIFQVFIFCAIPFFQFFSFLFPFVCENGTCGYSQCDYDDDVFHVDNIANFFPEVYNGS